MASGDFCEHDWPGSGCDECAEKYGWRKPPSSGLTASTQPVAEVTATGKDRGNAARVPASEIKQRVLGALDDFRDLRPEPGESWEDWYAAAFDMASEKIGELLEQGEFVPREGAVPASTGAHA